jgi:hypothetical protein
MEVTSQALESTPVYVHKGMLPHVYDLNIRLCVLDTAVCALDAGNLNGGASLFESLLLGVC